MSARQELGAGTPHKHSPTPTHPTHPQATTLSLSPISSSPPMSSPPGGAQQGTKRAGLLSPSSLGAKRLSTHPPSCAFELDAPSPACNTPPQPCAAAMFESPPPSPPPELPFSTMPLPEALAHVMGLIHTPQLSAPAASRMMTDVLDAWRAHVNPGFLEYRKSVANDYAAIEWADDKSDSSGCHVLDAAGTSYLDALSGFGCYNCGHSHPRILAAVAAQLGRQPLHSQELLDPLRAYAASLLIRTMPEGSPLRFAFFTSSGTESVEHALKFAILRTGRIKFIAVQGAFHGKTLGSLSGTSKAVFRTPFKQGLLPFVHVPVNDVIALRAAFASAAFTGDEIAGLLLEPVLGEGGIHPLTDDFMRLSRELCDASGSMLIFDEVQVRHMCLRMLRNARVRTGLNLSRMHTQTCPRPQHTSHSIFSFFLCRVAWGALGPCGPPSTVACTPTSWLWARLLVAA